MLSMWGCSAALLVAAACWVGVCVVAGAPAAAATPPFPEPRPGGGAVLLLGSRGLVGSALADVLVHHGYNVLEVRNRLHLDLRDPAAGPVLAAQRDVRLVVFLACEVGGSGFLERAAAQWPILTHNLRIYDTVFPWLRQSGVRFVFVSSYLAPLPGAYGAVKRVGEELAAALPHGKSVRLWNVYGSEPVGPKAHVVTDFVHACRSSGVVRSRTNGQEVRQFQHARDAAYALATYATEAGWTAARRVEDVASGTWVRTAAVAQAVVAAGAAQQPPVRCVVELAEEVATPRARVEPTLTTAFHAVVREWAPAPLALEAGIGAVFEAAAATATGTAPAWHQKATPVVQEEGWSVLQALVAGTCGLAGVWVVRRGVRGQPVG